jgi:hypothetical protein
MGVHRLSDRVDRCGTGDDAAPGGNHPVRHTIYLEGAGPRFENPKVSDTGGARDARGFVVLDNERGKIIVDLEIPAKDGKPQPYPGNGEFKIPKVESRDWFVWSDKYLWRAPGP